MKVRKFRYFAADFETTVYDNQQTTEVWSAACVELYTEDVRVYHSIADLYAYIQSLNCNVCMYFHNLKFDGAFWLDYLKRVLKYREAYEILDDEEWENGNPRHVRWLEGKEMRNKEFKYSISERGQWYTIIIKTGGHLIELRDSLKLLPFTLKQIGEAFKTKHRKLDMEYKGYRYAGCEISPEEMEYIKNDVLVLKEAMEFMFEEGHSELTIGSCCYKEFKKLIGKEEFGELFPNLYEIGLDFDVYGQLNAGEYIRKSYRGGWCYLVKGKENQVKTNGCTFDVNSLYPSVMHSESGNRYPVGKPTFWSGNYIPDAALMPNRYYFIRVKTRFYLKPGYLPFIQIKGDWKYDGTECLESSDVYNQKDGQYYDKYWGREGKLNDTRVTLTLTMTDYERIKRHYELVDFEILDGCYFYTAVGIFDGYINKYKKIKMESTGARRTESKLFLNNLYGKLSTSTDSSFKIAYLRDDGSMGFTPVYENAKEPGYIACGSAITSYARDFTIKAAQANYYGVEKPGFIYADTDSIHCDLPADEIKGVKIDPVNFCCWKAESCWDKALFVRQKTYMEHITHNDLKPVNPSWDIKCAGMPDKCKHLFELSMNGYDTELNAEDLKGEDLEFVKVKRELTDFKEGLKVPGKLMPKRIPGGLILVESEYTMRL